MTCTDCNKEILGKSYQPEKLIFCENCYKAMRREQILKTRIKNPFKYYNIKLKSRCKKDNIDFNLDAEYMARIWTGICPVYNTELQLISDKRIDNSAELDRFDPKKGYIKGNVTWLSSKANRAKNDLTIDELKKILRWMENRTENVYTGRIEEIIVDGISLKDRSEIKRKQTRKSKRDENSILRGENHPMAKLTEEQILEIRRDYKGQRGENKQLSDKYGVTPMAMSRILRKITYNKIKA